MDVINVDISSNRKINIYSLIFDIGIGLAGKRNKKTPLILIPSTISTKWNLARKPIDLQRKKTKKTYNVNFNSAF